MRLDQLSLSHILFVSRLLRFVSFLSGAEPFGRVWLSGVYWNIRLKALVVSIKFSFFSACI